MSEWQDIGTAPKDGTVILTFSDGDCQCCRGWRDGRATARWQADSWVTGKIPGWGALTTLNHNPTHWMPLPEPPK